MSEGASSPATSADAAAAAAAATASASPASIGQGAGTSSTTNPRNAGTKRKRPAAAAADGPGGSLSARGVANLTPEQLERKRANDREAQRAIRERTKTHIERLNARIKEFEQAQPYQELQAVVRQKEAVQQENDEMRRKMEQVMALLRPFVGGATQGLDGKELIYLFYSIWFFLLAIGRTV
jgi:hypothetical protein